MQDRGLAAYIAELIGTLLLVFFITSVVVALRIHRPERPVRIRLRGRRPDPLPRALRADHQHRRGERRALQPGGDRASSCSGGSTRSTGSSTSSPSSRAASSAPCSPRPSCSTRAAPPTTGRPRSVALLGGAFQGSLVEGIGAFVLVLTVLAVALNPEIRRWAALAIGGALGLVVMVFGPLTGGSFNPARWFGPALVGNHFTDAWAYIFGPIVGGLLAAAVYRFIIEPTSGPVQELADTVAPRGPAPPAGEAPPLRQERGRGPGGPRAGARRRAASPGSLGTRPGDIGATSLG